jgi:hypothetical protein
LFFLPIHIGKSGEKVKRGIGCEGMNGARPVPSHQGVTTFTRAFFPSRGDLCHAGDKCHAQETGEPLSLQQFTRQVKHVIPFKGLDNYTVGAELLRGVQEAFGGADAAP